MPTRKPQAVLEVRFDGPAVRPETIPLGTLARTLGAIQRLAAGCAETEEATDTLEPGPFQLLDVKRGSAVYQFSGRSPEAALDRLRLTGQIVQHPDQIGEHDFVMRPIEDLSAVASRLNAVVVIKEPGRSGAELARIDSKSFNEVASSVFFTGDTTITGRVERVGGATERRCGLRVGFQTRMLICRVDSDDLARQLGEALYQEVAVHGTASWFKSTWRIFRFMIKGVHRPKGGSIMEAIAAVRLAGGKDWERILDPAAYLEEVSGK